MSDPSSRIYQTSKRQTFHTDSADVVGLLCIRDARKGGKSLLVSVLSIYNEMLSRRPDLLIRLFDPIATDRRGEVPEGRKPYMEIPPLNWHDGYLTVFYQRQYIDSAQRFDDAMRLSARHVEALDLFDSLADDPELHLAMQLRPGDGICFASGCLLKATVRCPSVSRSDMARWKSAIAVESSPENHVMNFTHRFVERQSPFYPAVAALPVENGEFAVGGSPGNLPSSGGGRSAIVLMTLKQTMTLTMPNNTAPSPQPAITPAAP